jgi:hypothetical protein
MLPTDNDDAELKIALENIMRTLNKKPTKNSAAETLKEYCPDLYLCGWVNIDMTYSGSGDSCDDVEMHVVNEDGEELSFRNVELPPAVAFSMKDVENSLWNLLPTGFENNEGGSGTITVDTLTGSIRVEHDEYYTESRHTTEEY